MPETCLLLSFPITMTPQELKSLRTDLAGKQLGTIACHAGANLVAGVFPHPSSAADAALYLRGRCSALAAVIHAEAAEPKSGQPLVKQAEQLLLLAREGQILVSEAAAACMINQWSLKDCGYHRLHNLQDSVRVFALPGSSDEPLKSLDTLPHNLPAQFTTFVGRDAEMAAVAGQLQSARLVTLVGPGGVGKTRLAVQAAAALLDRYEDGAWFVPLEAVQRPDHLSQAVAGAMGVLGELNDAQADSLLIALKRVVAQRRFLLLLDNCEHLIEGCALLAHQLLVACPGLSILCTSREPLRIAGEVVVEVAPLSVPAHRRGSTAEQLLTYAAVQLFQERARSIQPNFAVTPQNVRDVADVCMQLDGIPLAIELAAARVSVLTPAELSARLSDRFGLLSSRNRLALPRHQTLRAAVEWSHQLLSEAEQVLWRRLSVFAGGFTLPAAEAIAAGGALEEAEVLLLLAPLADKSLLRVDRSGTTLRYSMLETIREFGQERLGDAEEECGVRRRHLAWFAGWVHEAVTEFTGPEQALRFQQIDQEIGNLQAAMAWSMTDPESALTGLRLASDLGYYWLGGRMKEGVEVLSELLALPVLQEPTVERVSALSVAGACGVHLGEVNRTRSYLQEGFVLAQQLGVKEEEAYLRNNLGQLAFHEGRLLEARTHYAQSLSLFRELGRHDGALVNLGNLAYVDLHLGDLAAAGALFDEAIAGLRGLDHPAWLCGALERASMQRLLVGRLEEARQLLSEGLALAAKLQDPVWSITCAERVCHWLLTKGRAESAAQLLGAVCSLRAAYSIPRLGWDQPLHVRLEESLRERLGPAACSERVSQAQQTSLEALLDKAQEWLEAPNQTHAAQPGGLTQREQEVVRLVAQGLPDREIAARLYLSRFTVNNHLRNIFGKLGISSRSALIPWAFAQGLAQPDSVPTSNT
ncbi:MAG TPA: LuxR C-terminal-related transcriptional regulator [Symbiobacteriaceae bacterium]|nr:LuxR C-terminal-related transcriptional regulator [Symbiobacteriaceae bacterium]